MARHGHISWRGFFFQLFLQWCLLVLNKRLYGRTLSSCFSTENMWVRRRGGVKTRAVYAAVDQSLEKDALRMMRSRERRENCCSYFEFFFFFPSWTQNQCKSHRCIRKLPFCCQTSAPCWRKPFTSLGLPFFFVQPKWFSDIFHVVTFRGYKTWAIAQIIEEAIVFLSGAQIQDWGHPQNAKWVSILVGTFEWKISFFMLSFHSVQFYQAIQQYSNLLVLLGETLWVTCLSLVLTGQDKEWATVWLVGKVANHLARLIFALTPILFWVGVKYQCWRVGCCRSVKH